MVKSDSLQPATKLVSNACLETRVDVLYVLHPRYVGPRLAVASSLSHVTCHRPGPGGGVALSSLLSNSARRVPFASYLSSFNALQRFPRDLIPRMSAVMMTVV